LLANLVVDVAVAFVAYSDQGSVVGAEARQEAAAASLAAAEYSPLEK
jgi:hypothetical protein